MLDVYEICLQQQFKIQDILESSKFRKSLSHSFFFVMIVARKVFFFSMHFHISKLRDIHIFLEILVVVAFCVDL